MSFRRSLLLLLLFFLSFQQTITINCCGVDAANTRTPTPVRTISTSKSETINETRTETLSKDIPRRPGRIDLVTALAVPALCMMATGADGAASASAGRACRNVMFNITNDAFLFQSRLLTLAVRDIVMKPKPCSRPCPYGFPVLFPKFSDQVVVTSNVTHLTVQLPLMPALSPINEQELVFDWHTRPVTLHGLKTSNPTSSIFVTPVTDIKATIGFLTVMQGMAGVFTFLSALVPSNPAVYDSQITALIATSECMHPGVRMAAAPGLRMLRPTVRGVLDPHEAVKGMWHNLVMALIFSSLHFFGASVARMRAITWIRAMHRSFFPALTYQISCVLSAGMLNGAIAVAGQYVPGGVEVVLHIVGAFIMILVLCLAVLPIVFRVRLFPAVARSHDLAAYEFPPLLRRLLAKSSWGPTDLAGMWFLPFGPCRHGVGHWATLSFSHTLVQTLILSLIPPSPAGCGGLAGASILVCIIYAFILIKGRPYRSAADIALSTVSALTPILPLGFMIGRATQLEETEAGENAISVLALCHFVAFLRALLALVAFAVEQKFIRPVVWADSIAALSVADQNLVSGGRSAADEVKAREKQAEEEEARKQDSVLVAGTAAAAAAAVSGGAAAAADRDYVASGGAQDQELLQELLLKQEQHRHQLEEQCNRGKNMTDDERKNFLFFGVPEPIGLSILENEKEKNAKKNADIYAETGNAQHMTRLMRGEGPMPPTLKKRMETEYKFL